MTSDREEDWENRFRQVFHGNAAAMVIAHPADLRIIDVNPRWLELFGATRDEIIGKTTLELGLISEDGYRERVAVHRDSSGAHDHELHLRTRDGRDIVVLASARPITIAEGRCTLTTLIDITARRHAEQAFAVAFSASPAGMALVHADRGTIIAVNRKLVEMIGYDDIELVDHPASMFDRIMISTNREQLLADIARAGRLDSVESELRRKDGTTIWAMMSTETVTLDGANHRITAFTDITSRKRFEQRLLAQDVIGRALAETSEIGVAFARVLEELCTCESWTLGAAWLAGADDTLACCGTWPTEQFPELAELAARTVPVRSANFLGGVLATGVAEKLIVDPAHGVLTSALAAAGMRIAVAFAIRRGSDVLGVVALAARDGVATLDTAERGVFDAIGRMLGLFVERARAEQSLRELNSELERRVVDRTAALETTNRDLEAFTFTVSHDLRAPLRAINAFSGALAEDHGATLPSDAAHLVTRIHEAGGRMNKQIDDLLTFARLRRERITIREVDLDKLVGGVTDELTTRRGLGDKLSLTVGELGTCLGDAAQLRIVWTNLLDNALKYSRTRDHMVIEIGKRIDDGVTIYYIRDNGVGFDPAHAGKLFSVFHRLHSHAEFEGTGIGLASVRRILDWHGGKIWATSSPGQGALFELTIGT